MEFQEILTPEERVKKIMQEEGILIELPKIEDVKPKSTFKEKAIKFGVIAQKGIVELNKGMIKASEKAREIQARYGDEDGNLALPDIAGLESPRKKNMAPKFTTPDLNNFDAIPDIGGLELKRKKR